MSVDQRTMRIAGVLYLLLAIFGAYSLMGVSSQVEIVKGDAIATANSLLANERLFRTSIFSGLVSATIFVFLVLYLYKLFKPVNEYQAKIMVGLVMVQVPISFVLGILEITSLMILKDGGLKIVEFNQLSALAVLLLRISEIGIYALMIFWGLWLIPLGQLVFNFGTIPRIVGALLIIAGFGYLVESAVFFLWPHLLPVIKKITFVLIFGELPVIFWLLIYGLMNRPLVPQKVTSET